MKNQKCNFKLAFTLAEVLITLGIIGVVAAMTIPILFNKCFEIIAVNRVKSLYAKLNESVRVYQDENECIDDIRSCFLAFAFKNNQSGYYDSDKAFDGIANYLKVSAVRRVGESTKNIDWLPDVAYDVTGKKPTNSALIVGKNQASNISANYLLIDGTTLTVQINNSNCGGSVIVIDINGKRKPNRVGKDQFPIGLGGVVNSEFTGNKEISSSVSPYVSVCAQGGGWNDVATKQGLCSVGWGEKCSPDDISSPTAYVLKHNKLPKPSQFGYPNYP